MLFWVVVIGFVLFFVGYPYIGEHRELLFWAVVFVYWAYFLAYGLGYLNKETKNKETKNNDLASHTNKSLT